MSKLIKLYDEQVKRSNAAFEQFNRAAAMAEKAGNAGRVSQIADLIKSAGLIMKEDFNMANLVAKVDQNKAKLKNYKSSFEEK